MDNEFVRDTILIGALIVGVISYRSSFTPGLVLVGLGLSVLIFWEVYGAWESFTEWREKRKRFDKYDRKAVTTPYR